MKKFKALKSSLVHKSRWAIQIFKKEGLFYLIKTIPESLFLKRDFYILVYELNEKMKDSKFPNNWKLVNNDFDLLDHYRKIDPNLPPEFYFDRIDGCREFYMLIIKNNGDYQPASICWLYNNQYVNRVIKLKNNEIEMKHIITLPEFRNIGIFSKMLYKMMIEIRSKGCKRVVSLIEKNNTASLTIFQRYGFSILVEWTFRKIIGLRVSPLFSGNIKRD
jgi:ribosomal protein S18 acetylase RimI-like enzyme